MRPHRVARHTAHGTRTGLTTPNTLPVRSAARFAPSCSRDVAHESRSAEAEALAWASVHGGGGAARGREGRHTEGTREAEEAARASETGRRGAWHLQRVHDRLGARSSAMTKATTQPAVRAEGRSPRRARSPPAWRIETSLRRKRVRGGGSRRACGARASGVEDRDEPAAQSRPGWRIEMSLRRASVPAARGSGGCRRSL